MKFTIITALAASAQAHSIFQVRHPTLSHQGSNQQLMLH
jgi:lytic cellulose monooxygenase (C1-hydroxylating)